MVFSLGVYFLYSPLLFVFISTSSVTCLLTSSIQIIFYTAKVILPIINFWPSERGGAAISEEKDFHKTKITKIAHDWRIEKQRPLKITPL